MKNDERGRKDNDHKRYYEAGGSYLGAHLLVLPGESELDYELLHTRVAEERRRVCWKKTPSAPLQSVCGARLQ